MLVSILGNLEKKMVQIKYVVAGNNFLKIVKGNNTYNVVNGTML
jgi:hypothetical protein